MGVHVAIVLYQISRPKVSVELKTWEPSNSKYLLISPDQAIIFPSSTYIRTLISKVGDKQVDLRNTEQLQHHQFYII